MIQIESYEGRAVDPFDFKPDQVSVPEIAHVLAMLPRFGGHGRFHYSLAQSSVLSSLLVPQEQGLPQVALLYDAPAAYIGEPLRPVASAITYNLDGDPTALDHHAAARQIRRQLLRALHLDRQQQPASVAGWQALGPAVLSKVRLRVLWTERATLMPCRVPWVIPHAPLVTRSELPDKWAVLFQTQDRLRELAPSQAEALFLERAAELGIPTTSPAAEG